jgi:thiamine biosynthesis lipoprotein ApbE
MAAAAVTDALTTAFMLLSAEEIATLCDRSPGLEAWVLPESASERGKADLIHFGDPQSASGGGKCP